MYGVIDRLRLWPAVRMGSRRASYLLALLYCCSSDTKDITNIQPARVASRIRRCRRHIHRSIFPYYVVPKGCCPAIAMGATNVSGVLRLRSYKSHGGATNATGVIRSRSCMSRNKPDLEKKTSGIWWSIYPIPYIHRDKTNNIVRKHGRFRPKPRDIGIKRTTAYIQK